MRRLSRVGDFLKISTDEGEVVAGIYTDMVMNDCHRPDYTGFLLADFSKGIPTQRVVYDFGGVSRGVLHVSNPERIIILSRGCLEEALHKSKRTIQQKLDNIASTKIKRLLKAYIEDVRTLVGLADNRADFLRYLNQMGETPSDSFVFYSPESNLGWNGALVNPAGTCMQTLSLSSPRKREELKQAWPLFTQNDRPVEFWPVERNPSDEAYDHSISFEGPNFF